MNVTALIACAALTCLMETCAHAGSGNSGPAIAPGAPEAQPAIRLQHTSQKPKTAPHPGVTASTPAVTNLQHATGSNQPQHQRLTTFRVHHRDPDASGDSAGTLYASPYAAPATTAPDHTTP